MTSYAIERRVPGVLAPVSFPESASLTQTLENLARFTSTPFRPKQAPPDVTRGRPASSLVSVNGPDGDCVTRCKLRGWWGGGRGRGRHKQTLVKERTQSRLFLFPLFPLFSVPLPAGKAGSHGTSLAHALAHIRGSRILSETLGSVSANLLRMGLAVHTHIHTYTRARPPHRNRPRGRCNMH